MNSIRVFLIFLVVGSIGVGSYSTVVGVINRLKIINKTSEKKIISVKPKNIKGKQTLANPWQIDENQFTLESRFIEDLGADSLDTVELIMQFEEEFDIEIPDEDAENLTTIGKSADYINNKLS